MPRDLTRVSTSAPAPPAGSDPAGTGRLRGVALSGAAARRWLQGHGWCVDADDRVLRLFADTFATESMFVARIWMSTARLRPVPGDWEGPGDVRVCVVVEGESLLSTSSGVQGMKPWDAFVIDPAAPARVESASGLAILQIATRQHSVAGNVAGLQLGNVLPGPGSVHVLASTINSLLASDAEPTGSTGRPAGHAIEYMLLATIVSDKNRSRDAETSLQRALTIIAQRHVDPEFSVAKLADTMSTGRRNLERVFAENGLTPSSVIRDARLATARALPGDARSDDVAAHLAGFRNARAMRNAEDASGRNATDPPSYAKPAVSGVERRYAR